MHKQLQIAIEHINSSYYKIEAEEPLDNLGHNNFNRKNLGRAIEISYNSDENEIEDCEEDDEEEEEKISPEDMTTDQKQSENEGNVETEHEDVTSIDMREVQYNSNDLQSINC